MTFELSSSLKNYSLDQDKVINPSQTAKDAVEKLSKMFDLSNVKLMARRDAVEGAYSFTGFSDQFSTSGKGLTPDQAKASAIMEFAERYSWLTFDYKNYDGYIVKSFNQLKSEAKDLNITEEYFLNNFRGLDNKKELLEEIKNIPLKWIKGDSLTFGKKAYYPINWHNMVFGTNGLAAGNSIEEAMLQALCEVVERENVFKLFVEERPGNEVDKSSIKNPLILEVLEKAQKEGIEFKILDISYDYKIPTFVVFGTSSKDEGDLIYKGTGQGSATNPEKALIRAISEYFESYSLIKFRAGEFLAKTDEDPKKYFSLLPKQHYGFFVKYNEEMLDKKLKTVKMSQVKNLSKPDIKDEIEEVLNILKKHKQEIIFVDKTNKKLQIPAVRIFPPGMRNIINTDIFEPYSSMSEVYYEAGNKEQALKYLKLTIQNNKLAAPSFPLIVGEIKVDDIMGGDYIENIKRFKKAKQSSMDFVNDVKRAKDEVDQRAKNYGVF